MSDPLDGLNLGKRRDLYMMRVNDALGLSRLEDNELPGERGFVGGLWEALKRGGAEAGREAVQGIKDVGTGIYETFTGPDIIERSKMSPLELLRGAGSQAGSFFKGAMGPFRTAYSPLSGLARTAVEAVPAMYEVPGQPISENLQATKDVAAAVLSIVGPFTKLGKMYSALPTTIRTQISERAIARGLGGASDDFARMGLEDDVERAFQQRMSDRVVRQEAIGAQDVEAAAEQARLTARRALPPGPGEPPGGTGIPWEGGPGNFRRPMGDTRSITRPGVEPGGTIPPVVPPRATTPLDVLREQVEAAGGAQPGGPSLGQLMRERLRAERGVVPPAEPVITPPTPAPPPVPPVARPFTPPDPNAPLTGFQRPTAETAFPRRSTLEQLKGSLEDIPPRSVGEVPPTVSTQLPLRDRVKLAAAGETEKVAAARSLPDDELAAAPSHIQNAVRAEQVIDSPTYPGWAQPAMEWLRQKKFDLPTVINIINPRQMAKGNPTLEKIVDNLEHARNQIVGMSNAWTDEIRAITKMVGGREKMIELSRMRDLKQVPRDPVAVQAMNRLQALTDDMGKSISITPDHPMYEPSYYPRWMRGHYELEGVRVVEKPNGYVPDDLVRMIPSQMKPAFSKGRVTAGDPALRYDPEVLEAHAKGVARASVLGTPQHMGLLEDLKPLLKDLETRPKAEQEWVANYLNYFIGAPGTRSSEAAQKWGSAIRGMEFVRTLALRPISGLYNATQQIPIFAEVGARNYAGAWNDVRKWAMRDPEMMNLVKKAGLDLKGYGNKVDLENLDSALSKWEGTAGKIKDALVLPFSLPEGANRLSSLFAGYRRALSKGLEGEEAVRDAMRLVEKTQFLGGAAGRSAALRSELGATLGQYGQYKINMATYIYNNAADALKAATMPGLELAERAEAWGKFLRFWGATYAIGGPATIPFLGDKLKENIPWKGVLPSLGIAIKNQMGLGAVDVRDVKTFMYNLPGPALSHMYDILRGLHMDDLANEALNLTRGGARGDKVLPAEPGEQAKLLTRSFLGMAAETARRGFITEPSGIEREPQSLKQAFGLERIPRTQPIVMEGTGRLAKTFGITSPEQEAAYEKQGQIGYAELRRNQVMRQAAELYASGQSDQASRLLRNLERELGLKPYSVMPSPQSRKAVETSARLDPLARLRQRTRRSLQFDTENEVVE